MPTLGDGQIFERYRVIRWLGSGIAGESYEAEDTILLRKVTLKLIHPWGTLPDSARRQFFRELQGLSALNHPYLATMLDYGEIDGRVYVARRYLSNGSLLGTNGRLWFRPPLGTPETFRYAHQLAQALHYIHQHGYLHGSLTFANVLILRGPNVEHEPDYAPFLVADVGLANFVRRFGRPKIATLPVSAAPEQLSKRVTPASDQFALAVLVYFWLTGRPPYLGTPDEVEHLKLTESITPLHTLHSGITAEQDSILLRALKAHPEERHPSILAFAEALLASLSSSRPAQHTPTGIFLGQPETPLEILRLDLEKPPATQLPVAPTMSAGEAKPSEVPPPNVAAALSPDERATGSAFAPSQQTQVETWRATLEEIPQTEPGASLSVEETAVAGPELEAVPLPAIPETPRLEDADAPASSLPHQQESPVSSPDQQAATRDEEIPAERSVQAGADIAEAPEAQPESAESGGGDESDHIRTDNTQSGDGAPALAPGEENISTVSQIEVEDSPANDAETQPSIEPVAEQPAIESAGSSAEVKATDETSSASVASAGDGTGHTIQQSANRTPRLIVNSPYTSDSYEFLLTSEETRVGRAGSSDLRLEQDNLTSRHHALIKRTGECVLIFDRHSYNGVFLNGQRIEVERGYELADGDHIGIGSYELIFRAAPAQPISPKE
jgi:serine/threonine protein kinase